MSERIKDGGPAFPEALAVGPAGDVYPGMGGMSLRDYFAAKALSGHLASLAPGSWGNDRALAADAAKGAYLVADAMLAAREVKP